MLPLSYPYPVVLCRRMSETASTGSDRQVISKHEQGRDVFDAREIAGANGSLHVEVHGLDCVVAKDYRQGHGMPPRW